MEEAKKALEGKDKEVKDLEDRLRRAKEVAINKYRDSDTPSYRVLTTPSVRLRRPTRPGCFKC